MMSGQNSTNRNVEDTLGFALSIGDLGEIFDKLNEAGITIPHSKYDYEMFQMVRVLEAFSIWQKSKNVTPNFRIIND